VVTYRGPVDCTAVARDARLVFVKNHIALSTCRGYKYAGWCGVDVWNLSTGRCRPLLMFDRYGRLDQLEVTLHLHHVSKIYSCHFYFWSNSVKHWPILIIVDTQRRKETRRKRLWFWLATFMLSLHYPANCFVPKIIKIGQCFK